MVAWAESDDMHRWRSRRAEVCSDCRCDVSECVCRDREDPPVYDVKDTDE